MCWTRTNILPLHGPTTKSSMHCSFNLCLNVGDRQECLIYGFDSIIVETNRTEKLINKF